jgi:2-oxo-4-hydroxy-4-carboxy-5-ureidoimidazoline decarboxylase
MRIARTVASIPPARQNPRDRTKTMPNVADLNGLSSDAFVAALGHLFEHSPWIVEQAAARRPFADREALHAAMMAVIRAAPEDAQLALIRAHPDLAGKAARAGTMTQDSVREQAGAGLDRLSDEEHARFDRLNRAYRERFGFPFIVAVRRQTKDSILAAYERRLLHDRTAEIACAIEEIGHISRLRLEESVGG